MAHDHGHHKLSTYNRAFAVGVLLNVAFVAAEAGFGILSGSLSLLADAGHNLSDVLGLLLAWGASYLVQRRTSERRTYGWRKSSILAALMNAVLLMVAVGGIAWEAVRRIGQPVAVAGETIILVAAAGVVVNTATALLFLSGRKKDLNIRGAFLHMAADAAVSAGVAASGVAILATGWAWLDPAVSLVVSAIIVAGTWGLLKDSLNLALDAVPAGIDPAAVKNYLAGLPGVEGIHDLHIWAMSTTETALTAHMLKPDAAGDDQLIRKAGCELGERFGIAHVTIQLERSAQCTLPGAACDM
jgi:cobalt-zinc-cadmium efflux system protein